MKPHQVIDWTEERVAELREMAKTMTAGLIAMEWHVKRNVICGKMARMGIKRPERMTPLNPKSKPPRVERRGGFIQASPTRPPLNQMPCQAPAEPTHKSSSKSVDIWHLTGRSCRYPLWRDSEPISQKFYCGDTAIDGLPYCDACAKIAFSGRSV